uniref:SOSS complex subunit C-like n=1 Tax=Jaculus jaculus TaxID=51337 RepID=UPI001E1B4D40|nr:SOSS complex subunit C-like [Jaculus jaculus]
MYENSNTSCYSVNNIGYMGVVRRWQQVFQNKNRVAILAELDKEKRKLLMQNQSSTTHPGASIALSRPSLNKDFRDRAEQQHTAAQRKAALQHAHARSSGYFITQDSAFGNLILPVLPLLDPE